MYRLITILLLLSISLHSNAQEEYIGEEVQENLAAFGFCIMPNNTTFLTLEADYDGIYIRERELVDLFETSQFEYSKELENWTYYDYWVLNNRTLEQPEKNTFYQMTVDPTGTYIAIAPEWRDVWSTSIKIYNKSSQTLFAEFDLKNKVSTADFINLARFDGQGKNLILGAVEQGIYSFNLANKEIIELYPANTYQLNDYDYVTDTPILKAYVKTSEGDYILDPDLFILKGGTKQPVTLPLPLHYTRVLTPTQTHKYYGLFYEQDYDTYLAPIDDFNYQIIYRNKELFKFRTREVPKE